jgi:ketopantoate hydroxymethyltransferase
MGHLGLTPQSIYKFGTYTVRAKDEAEAEKLKTDALALQQAGCFALVLEKIPAKLAREDCFREPANSYHWYWRWYRLRRAGTWW